MCKQRDLHTHRSGAQLGGGSDRVTGAAGAKVLRYGEVGSWRHSRALWEDRDRVRAVQREPEQGRALGPPCKGPVSHKEGRGGDTACVWGTEQDWDTHEGPAVLLEEPAVWLGLRGELSLAPGNLQTHPRTHAGT